MKPEAEDWLRLAAKDLAAARKLEADEELRELACFHCHQAVEKGLKAFLAQLGERAPRTHDLASLVQSCASKEPGFSAFVGEVSELNPYYVGTRYPPRRPGLEITPEKMSEALRASQRVLQFVEGKLA